MRIIASADVHGFLEVYQWLVQCCDDRQVDALVLAGDLLTFETEYESIEDGMRASSNKVAAVLSELSIPVLYIMGNDDVIDLQADLPNLIPIHEKAVELRGFRFVGYAGGPRFLGGPYDRDQARLDDEIAALKPLLNQQTILITHYPARGTLDGESYSGGLESLRRLIEDSDILAHVHGHVHRTFGRHQRHFNVASAGEKRCMLIELPSTEHEILYG